MVLASCNLNNPYRSDESEKDIYYTSFSSPPKHLDPARSYSSNEYDFLAQIYEPIIQYHYLKRPYTLIPATATEVPRPNYFDKNDEILPATADPALVKKASYNVTLKKGILFQDHPAFAKDADGEPLYFDLTEKDIKSIFEPTEFPEAGTRELTADDYIYQIKRLADPMLHCPILPVLSQYILGMDELNKALGDELKRIRDERKKAGGIMYSQEVDEKNNPILLDYDKFPLKGIEKTNDHSFKIILKRKYPQFIFWLSMPFFSPVPKEAELFYKQGVLAKRNITLDRFPVGTGPYRFERYNQNMEIVLTRNENFHTELYPAEGEVGDREKGLLKHAGEELPLTEKVVFRLEKEAIPRWNKFLQGYYDSSGISSDSFDAAVTMSAEGGTELTEAMQEKNISLLTSVMPSIFYLGFNMTDKTVGGLSEKKRKLRQAIAIAVDIEEFIEIFNNGRGIAAQSPLPPGIFGYSDGKDGINPYVYDWNEKSEKPKRKSLEEAKKLLKEAGYPNGRTLEGKPLIISFDNYWTAAGSKPLISWLVKRFKMLGIHLENKTTDYNRFQEKVSKGDFQFYFWGWNADYPDPENFFFLLYGPNGKIESGGANSSNYSNPKFDTLFKLMENMDNTEERLRIVKSMTRIAQEDAPWLMGYYPISFGLLHEWVENSKPNTMANNTIKYKSINKELRNEKRTEWNKPVLWPLILVLALIMASTVPALLTIRKKMGGK